VEVTMGLFVRLEAKPGREALRRMTAAPNSGRSSVGRLGTEERSGIKR
jgi:hypothetical protein